MILYVEVCQTPEYDSSLGHNVLVQTVNRISTKPFTDTTNPVIEVEEGEYIPYVVSDEPDEDF